MTFAVDVARFAEKTNSSLDEASRAIKISLFSRVIADTRVDTGRLRGNWQTSTGTPETGTTDRLDPNGQLATKEAEQTVTADQVDYFTNNLPYAEVWEQEDGMIARNMERIQRIVGEVARDVRD